jgi:hypothetical protein
MDEQTTVDSTASNGDMASVFAETLSAASPAATTPEGTTPPPASASAATTVPPGDSAASTGIPATPQGPIPFDRHQAALDNARTKAKDEALAEWRQQHGWAEHVDRAAVEQAQRVGQLYAQNRVAFVDQLLQDALQNQTDGPQILSLIGRALASRRGQSAQLETEPEPDLQTEDGRGVYSATQLQKWRDWNNRQLEARFDQKLQPLQSAEERRAQDAAVAEMRTQAVTDAQALLTELRQSPGFKEHEVAIKAAMTADPKLSVEAAYRKVVVPKLSQTERQAVVADLQKTATATTASPTHSSAAPPKSYASMGFAEALRHELAAARRS